jgi:hypothetical protein
MDERSNEESDQRRDAMLLRALKTAPLSRAQLQEELKQAREAKRKQASAGVESPLGETMADH